MNNATDAKKSVFTPRAAALLDAALLAMPYAPHLAAELIREARKGITILLPYQRPFAAVNITIC